MRTSIRKIASQEVTKNTNHELDYTVPAGKLLTITEFWGGHEYSEFEVRIELVIDGLLHNCLYGQNAMYKVSDYVTAGAVVKIKLVNKDPHNIHMTGGWKGYLTDV